VTGCFPCRYRVTDIAHRYPCHSAAADLIRTAIDRWQIVRFCNCTRVLQTVLHRTIKKALRDCDARRPDVWRSNPTRINLAT